MRDAIPILVLAVVVVGAGYFVYKTSAASSKAIAAAGKRTTGEKIGGGIEAAFGLVNDVAKSIAGG